MLKNRDFRALLGSRIAKLRKIKGFSQEKFAERIDISQRTLSRIETGAGFTEFKTIEKIAKELELGPAELFNFCEEYSEKELIKSINEKMKFIKNDIDKLRIVNDFLKKIL